MNQKKMYVIIGVALAILLAGGASTYTYVKHQQRQADSSLYAKESAADKIAGFDGQSTKIDADEESLAAPNEMKVQGLQGVPVEESPGDSQAADSGVSGLEGLKIE